MSEVVEIVEPVFEAERVTLRDGREVVLRAGIADDAAAVLAYINRCLPDFSPYVLTRPDEFTVTEAFEREWLASQCATPGACVVLAFAGEQIVGLLNCSANPGRRRIAHVGQVGISSDKAYWGSGLGSAMMARLIDWAEANPVLGLLQLQVYADNERAIRLYKGHGFVEAGTIPRRTRFDDGSERDDLIMYRRVDGTLSDKPNPGDLHVDLGDGVVMRQIRYADAEALMPVYERNRERLRPWLRWEQGIKTVGDVRDGIAQWTEATAERDELTVVLESSAGLIGMLFICSHNVKNRRMELGYWVDGAHEGRGLVTRGCRELIRYGFERMGVARVELTCQAVNTRSRAVAERLGFTLEAELKHWQLFPDGRFVDVLLYRLLREEWTPEASQ